MANSGAGRQPIRFSKCFGAGERQYNGGPSMNTMGRILAAACILGVAAEQCCAGTHRYVSTTGGNIPPYDSWAKASSSPDTVIGVCSNGDTIYIAPGNYYGMTVNRAIKVYGSGPGVVFNGHGGKSIKIQNSLAVVGNIDVTGSRAGLGAGVDMDFGTLQDSRIYGNHATMSGGGIFINSGGYVVRCEIYNNTSDGGGAGVSCSHTGYIEDCRIYGNSCSNSGGGVSLHGYLIDSDVYGNSAGEGGGVCQWTNAWITGCRIYNNTATNGAGVSSRSFVESSWISHNSGKGCKGAGMMLYPGGSAINCVIDFNTANSGRGGGIYFNGGGYCGYCTIANNQATGILFPAGSGGGVCLATNGSISYSIIYGNLATNGSNHYETASSWYLNTCTLPAIGTDAIGADPRFVNGAGGNFRLQRESPCVDGSTGVGMIEDVSGVPRPMDGNFDGVVKIDVGAYERGHVPSFADYDGDGRADVAVYSPSTFAWYITSTKWGLVCFGQGSGGSNAIPLRADLDGNGKTDLVTYKDGSWVSRSVGSSFGILQNWGFAGCVPVPADYDGDGYSDLAVFYPPTGDWYIRSGRSGVTIAWATKWGFSGCVPVPGDYDGDGNSDLGLYNPASGLWYIGSLTRGVLAMGANWGFAGCTPVSGDYDGDGRSDLAVFNASLGKWYVRTLSGTVLSMGASWGFAGCKAVSGDFDADGKYDLAVYHQASGTWYIRSLLGGAILWQQWGWVGADPVP